MEALIAAQGLTKEYGGKAVLTGVDLTLLPGQTAALMGKSGCGKTTLLKLLAGLERAGQGQLLFRGQALHPGQLRRYRQKQVGYLPQQGGLIDELTALQNVALGAWISKSGADPMECLRQVGLEEYGSAWPRQLSGGQFHRVALARALAKAPSLLLLDEPTEGLDRQTGQEILDLTLSVCKDRGLAMIMVTHTPEHGERTDCRWLLQDGRLEQEVCP